VIFLFVKDIFSLDLANQYRETTTDSQRWKELGCLIYPDLPEKYIRIGGILFVCLYVVGYAYLAKRYRILGRIKRQ
jgi:hypothetical protein